MSERSLVFHTIGNAGMSFSDTTNNGLIRIFDYLNSLPKDLYLSYKDLQQKIEDNAGVTASNVRMYSPFLGSLGFVSYKGKFKAGEYFTRLGKAYIQILRILNCIEGNPAAKKKAEEIKGNILVLGLVNKRNSNSKDYYYDFLELCLKYNYTNITEFNIMLYEKAEKKSEDYLESIASEVRSLRESPIEYRFMQDRTSKSGEQTRALFPDNTFNYTRSLLLESKLVEETTDKNYVIATGKKDIVVALVKGEL